VEGPLAAAHHHRVDPEAILIDEAVPHQRLGKLTAALDQDALAWLPLQLGDCLRDIPLEQDRVPRKRLLQCG